MNNESIGLTVSGVYTYTIELENSCYGGTNIRKYIANDTSKAKIVTNFNASWSKTLVSDSTSNIRRDNTYEIADLMTNQICEMYSSLYEDVNPFMKTDEIKYLPRCLITFTDIESLKDDDDFSIGKNVKSFNIRVEINKYTSNNILDKEKLKVGMNYIINEKLLDVIDQLKEEVVVDYSIPNFDEVLEVLKK